MLEMFSTSARESLREVVAVLRQTARGRKKKLYKEDEENYFAEICLSSNLFLYFLVSTEKKLTVIQIWLKYLFKFINNCTKLMYIKELMPQQKICNRKTQQNVLEQVMVAKI